MGGGLTVGDNTDACFFVADTGIYKEYANGATERIAQCRNAVFRYKMFCSL